LSTTVQLWQKLDSNKWLFK